MFQEMLAMSQGGSTAAFTEMDVVQAATASNIIAKDYKMLTYVYVNGSSATDQTSNIKLNGSAAPIKKYASLSGFGYASIVTFFNVKAGDVLSYTYSTSWQSFYIGYN